MLLTWNPSPTSAFKQSITLEYLILPPRSALRVAPPLVTHRLRRRPHAFPPTRRPLPRREGSPLPPRFRPTAGSRYRRSCFSALHFRGRSIRQVSCYTLLSGCRLPWPPSCCLDESTPFMGSSEQAFRQLNPCVWFIPHRHSCLPGLAHLKSAPLRFGGSSWETPWALCPFRV